ncbi:MAG: hypothetical protein O7G88_18740 [bacterium]|nr:hypothetical protein [bacterium]
MTQAASAWRQQQQEQQRRQEEHARQQKLEVLALRKNQVWDEIDVLIEEKQAKPYEQAVQHLKDLRDLTAYQGNMNSFGKRMAEIAHTYANRPALLRRLQAARLV